LHIFRPFEETLENGGVFSMDKAQSNRKPQQRRDGEMKEMQAMNEKENKERKWQQQRDQARGGGY
jgi:hypothetical protein